MVMICRSHPLFARNKLLRPHTLAPVTVHLLIV
jgi:hypothetical protein